MGSFYYYKVLLLRTIVVEMRKLPGGIFVVVEMSADIRKFFQNQLKSF